MADEGQTGTETTEPQVDPETQKKAEEEVAGIDKKYEPGSRPTVTLPGTGGMVSGTAFADMVDEDGNLKDDDSKGDSTGDSEDDSSENSGSEGNQESATASKGDADTE